jgi:phenylacetate-CoA ligase
LDVECATLDVGSLRRSRLLFPSAMTFSPTDDRPGRSAPADFAFWPTLGPVEAQIVSLYRQLESSQWWPAEKLREWQFAQARRLVAHSRQHVPFYTETLGRLLSATESGIDESAWRSLPILTKQKVRAEHTRLRSRDPQSSASAYSEWTTGTSGQPLEVFKTPDYNLLFRAIKLRMLRWYGFDPKRKLCEIRRPFWKTKSAVYRLPCWEWPFGNLFQSSPQVSMDIFTEIEAQVHFLETEAPDYLLTFPSNLRLLLRAFRRAGKRLPSLRLVRTMTERLDPDLRRECQEVLGVPILDVYGATEMGFIAIQCPEHNHYHVQSELNLVEVLRKDGTPCQAGETGRIVITPLHAFAMPLLRYEMSDYAEVGEPCPCGRGLPVLRQIYGRKQETLTLPSGERRFSIEMWIVFENIHPVIQAQLIQKSLTVLELRMVTERPLDQGACNLIIQRLTRQVGPGFDIRLVFVDSIPRPPGGKHMDFFSEIETGNQ